MGNATPGTAKPGKVKPGTGPLPPSTVAPTRVNPGPAWQAQFQPVALRRLAVPQSPVTAATPAPAPVTLLNNAEGGTSGTTVTQGSGGNSGGISGNYWDTITIGSQGTLAFDNTHAAHGSLSYKFATAATSSSVWVQWDASAGTLTTVWFRMYLFFTGFPAANIKLIQFLNVSTQCGDFQLNTSGKIDHVAGTGSTATSTGSVAIGLNQWVRLEGLFTASATAGQLEHKLFNTADNTVPDETLTDPPFQNTNTAITKSRIGIPVAASNTGPFWLDDLGLSNQGYLGPVGNIVAPTAAFPGPVWLARFQPYRPRPQMWLPAPPPAQNLTITLPVTVATTGTVTDQVSKTLAGPVTTTGVIQDRVAKTFPVATVTTTVSLANRAGKTLAATVSTAAALARTAGKTLAATATTAGMLTRQVAKTLTQTVTTTGGQRNQPGKTLPATVTTSAALGPRALSKTFAAAAATAGALARTVAKTIPVTVTTAAAITTGRLFTRVFTATVTTTGTLARGIGKALKAAVTTVASYFTPVRPPAPAVITITPVIAADVAIISGIAAAVDIEPAGNATAVVTAQSRAGRGGSVILHP